MGLIDRRRTGRTTRMLEAALEAAKRGGTYVLASQDQVEGLTRRLWALYGEAELPDEAYARGVGPRGIKVEVPSPSWCWRTMRSRGAHPATSWFVDHWLIESRFEALLRELHRFDRSVA